MLQLILLRPGSTEFDEQGRIAGRLDMPLSELGKQQVTDSVLQLADRTITAIYCCPSQSALETARALAKTAGIKPKKLEKLANLDQGLWHGKLIAEVKQHQPRVYKQWQEKPETVCPPGGESLNDMRDRVQASVKKMLKKHRTGVIVLVAPEPLASLVRSFVTDSEVGNLWAAECEKATWEIIDLPQPVVHPA